MDSVTTLLTADRLYRFYHAGDAETLALQGVSLDIGGGEMVAVTGPSGSGKSTLLACLAGIDEPTGGMVRVAGRRLSRRPERERAALRAAHIGMLAQSANLVEHLGVHANVALAQRLAASASAGAPPPVAELLDRVGLAQRARARPSQLSGGELARAGLAVALANAPDVLLADEPTGELDGVTARRVLGLLRELADGGAAVVVVTHNPLVAAASDRTIELADGRVVA